MLEQEKKLPKALDTKGRKLIKALRHDPASLDLILDKEGWAATHKVLEVLDLKPSELSLIVELNDKKRFELDQFRFRIRAVQGHSIEGIDEIEKSWKKLIPTHLKPAYHGTTNEVLPLILENGIHRMKRNFVHLSPTPEIANKVASRHGKDIVILEINLQDMIAYGFDVYQSDNSVILTKHVPAQYIKKIVRNFGLTEYYTDSRKIAANKIMTPDGTILESKHQHDHPYHKDKITKKEYSIDGGHSHLSASGPGDSIDLHVFENAIFEVKRENMKWGHRGKNGDEELTFVKISEMANEHIFNVLRTVKAIEPLYVDVFLEEIKYRRTHNIFIEQ